jgi:hypothetical protein
MNRNIDQLKKNSNNTSSLRIEDCLKDSRDTLKDPPAPQPETVHEATVSTVSSRALLEVVKTRQGSWDRDLYILNPDQEITGTIRKTFEAHGCSVQVGGLERDLAYLYVLLDLRVSVRKLRRLMERGKKFGLKFFLTKSGLTSSLLARCLPPSGSGSVNPFLLSLDSPPLHSVPPGSGILGGCSTCRDHIDRP